MNGLEFALIAAAVLFVALFDTTPLRRRKDRR